jgi:hypothetical protein
MGLLKKRTQIKYNIATPISKYLNHFGIFSISMSLIIVYAVEGQGLPQVMAYKLYSPY